MLNTDQDVDPLNLTQTQKHALTQLRELTNGADDEVTIGLLSSVGWDVQKAAEMIFESFPSTSGFGSSYRYPPASSSSPSPAGPSSSSPSGSGSGSSSSAESNLASGPSGLYRERQRIETFEVDDSSQGNAGRRTGGRGRGRPLHIQIARIGRLILTILTLPLHLVTGLVRFLFTLLRIPVRIPGPPASLSLGSIGLSSVVEWFTLSGGARGYGMGGPERWIRELEEETGGVCLRRKNTSGVASGVAVGMANGLRKKPSTNGLGLEFDDHEHTDRGGGFADRDGGGRKYLPDFELCTYEEMLKKCQRELKVGCVVLVSEEHDDVKEFKRSTLTDPGLVRALSENEIIVWGGDVRDREAWSASEKLQATTYPFVAFIALQPRRNPGGASSNSSAPTLTILSRHQGPSIQSGPTSASTLKTHIEGTVLPRVTPYLAELNKKQKEREKDRELRAEQDRAFEEAARKDKERIERKMREEREREEERVRAERKEEEERMRKVRRREVRKWTRRCLVKGKQKKELKKGVRIGIRLPTGTRLIETIETVTGLYAFVDAQFLDEGEKEDADPAFVEGTELVETGVDVEEALERYVLAQGGSDEYWGFRMSTAYPRKEIWWGPQIKLVDIPELRGGGQVVVEELSRNTEEDLDSD